MFNHIVMFTHLVETNSFRHTAELLRMSQSTVSRKLAELENYVGEQLLLRDTRNISLSAAGLLLYNKFKNLNLDLETSIREIHPNIKEYNNQLTLCLYNNVIAYGLICPCLQTFSKMHPEVALNIIFYSVDIIHRTNYDIGLSYEIIDSEEYSSHLIRSDSLKLYCVPSYIKSKQIPSSIEDLQNHNLIGILDSLNLNPIEQIRLTNKYTKEQILFDILFDIKNTKIRTNLAYCAENIGKYSDSIFFHYESYAEKEVLQGNLIPVLPEYELKDTPVYLVNKRNLDEHGLELTNILVSSLKKDLRRNFKL